MNRMIQKLALLLVILLGTYEMNANPVDIRTARDVAMKFMNANAKNPLRGENDLQLVTTYNISRGDAAFYIFNIPNGFVIVSADDCATPILGYSNEGQFDVDNIPIQLQDYLQGFVEQIQYGIENHIEADAQKAKQWEMVRTTGRLTDNRSDEVVGPLVTALWNQTCYYNSKCPEDPYGSCGHVLVGCVATSMSQIMHYWGYPEHGSGSYSYTPSGYPEQSVDFGSTIYDWANMPNSLNSSSTSEQIDAVATLMWHCGVSVAMHYGPNFSGSWLSPSSLINYFNYSDEMSYEYRNDYSDAIWKAKLKDCLNLQRPLWYDGSPSYGSGGAHAFVCDGYDNNDMFHFNWGWGGSSDGFFTLDDNLYDRYNGAVFNIHPQSDGPTVYEINVSVKNNEGGTVSGGGTFVHGDTVTLSATADEGLCFQYWEENGGIASRDANYSFPANFSRNLEAVFNVPVTVSLLAMEGGSVSGEGIYCYGECEVIAMPDEGYDFAYWTENGEIVSIEADYVFLLIDERHLTAHFVEERTIDFADNNVKTICLSHWDNNDDGELSLAEAFRVMSLGQVFKNNSNISSFDELQYFTNVTSINDQAFYNCYKLTSITIPNTVTSLGGSAFRGCSKLTSVTLSDSLISIGGLAFYGCSNLTSLTLPNTVTSIGGSAFRDCSKLTSLILPNTISVISDYAFYGCSSLASLTIPNSITSIGNYAFYGCSGLTSLVLPNFITSIGNNAFYGCNGLTSLVLPNSITSIGNYAFYGCNGLTSLVLPNSITSIGNYAFYGCSGLTSLVLPNSITSIGNSAFSNCIGLTALFLPNSITSIGSSAFRDCSSLTSLILPNSITSISDYAFRGCNNLTSLTISDSVTTIGSYAFYGCKGMTSLIIPNSVFSINANAFYDCIGLTSIIVLAETPPTLGSNSFYNVSHDILVYVPCESVGAYQSANGWNVFSDINGICTQGTIVLVADLPEGGEVTGAGTYEGGSSCSVIATPNEGYYFVNWTENGNVVSFDANYNFIVTDDRLLTAHFALDGNIVFADANVKAICVANWDTNGDGELSYSEASSVTSIGEMFKGNTEIISFEELRYFVNLTSIGNNAFKGCSSLSGSLILPNTVTLIGTSAFQGCSGMTGPLTLPDFINTIGDYAFYNCSGFIGDLTIPHTVTTIGDYAFYNCNGFNGHLSLPSSIMSIGEWTFYGCSGFTGDLTVPNAVTSIGKSAFRGCSGFTGKLTIGGSVTSIGDYAFYYCYGLTGSLTIPNAVNTIGDYAFYGCGGFTGSLTIPNSVWTIGEMAFCYLNGLKGSLTISSSVYSIGRFAFYGTSDLMSIIVLRQQPATAVSNSFEHDIPLFVPCESVEAYQSATGWSAFTNIFGMCSAGTISVISDPTEGGEVSGAGIYDSGTTCTLTATPNEGYRFAVWTENGSVVSFDSSFSFVVTGESVLIAHFVSDGNIVFADDNVKGLCVQNWDANGDGELSYHEAALVTSLVDVFSYNDEITSFDELQYFIGLSAINSNAFNSCYNLSSVIIPSTVNLIEGGAFYGCGSLTGSLTLPNSLTVIGSSAFYGCSGLTGCLTIPDAVTSIGYGAFEYCSGLTGLLNIGNSVTSIGNYAFSSCYGLTSLIIGNAVTSIGNYAFYYCHGLTSVYVLPEMPSTLGSYAFSQVDPNIPLYVPCESIEAYQSSAGWDAFTNIIGMCSGGMASVVADPIEGGTVSGAGMYEGGSYCTVTATPNEGFYFANWTKDGNMVSNDAVYTFVVTGESVLTAHFVPEGNIVFADSNVKSICVSNWDANDDGELNYLEAARVSSLGQVFSYNEEITSFDELQYFIGLSSIDDDAFYNCYNMTSMTLPNSVTTIGNYAFSNCYSLRGSLTIPSFVTMIGEWAFSNCSRLMGSLTFGNSVTSIGKYAFYECYGLRSLTFGNSVTSIDNGAFAYCSGLESMIVLSEMPPTMGSNTFNQVSTDIPVYVPCESVDAYQLASGWETFQNFVGMCSSGTVSVASDPVEGGTVSGAGTYDEGIFCTVTATPNEGYYFANWTKNGSVVSNDSSYSFVVTGESVLIAHFVQEGNIVFVDDSVKVICVDLWDTNGDGELSYLEAARVTNLEYAFQYNPGITSFDELQYFIGLSSINEYEFNDCYNLTSLYIPNSVNTIGDGAFEYCGLIGTLTIPNSVTSIGNYAFGHCSGLKGSLTIPNSVTWIGNGAFTECYNLTGPLTIGNSVTSIGNYAFSYCYDLKSIIVLAEMPPTVDLNTFSQIPTNIPVYVLCETVDVYQLTAGWNTFQNIVGMCSSGTITVTADPIEGGLVSGTGTYEGGTFCTVTATPNEGYSFVFWMNNGNVVSNESNYSFVVTGGSDLIAYFVLEGNIVFADANVKAICVNNWDTNGDGELSYLEAASVTSLGNAFQSNMEITSFEELRYFISLSSIDSYAFYMCSNLSGFLNIPQSVTTIGYDAFYNCSGLTGLLKLPDFMTTIGSNAFYGCSGLTGSLTIPNSVTSIGYDAFYNCRGLTGSLTIGNSVPSIGSYTFYNCNGLTSLTIGESASSISNYAFSYCNGLNSMIVLPETPPTVEPNTFYQVPTNIPVYVPCESVEAYQSTVGWDAFSNIVGMCSSGNITVAAEPEEGGTVTGAGTYEGGTFCTVIATPNAGFCFANWTNNSGVVSNESNFSFVVTGERAMTAHFVQEGNIVFADANVKAICVTNWDTNGDGELSYQEAALVTSLGEVFTYNEEITSFEELKYFIGLSSISANAFYGCSGLTGLLIIPNSVTSIENGAFEYCSGLTGSLTIPDAVTSIGNYAFYNCSGLTGPLTMPNSLISIGNGAFGNCSGLTGTLTIPDSVNTIGSSAFYNCYGLTGSLTIPNSVTSIGNSAFYNCYGLTGSLTLPDSMTTIGSYAFYNCYGLTGSLIIPNSVTSIGSRAFYYCRGLTILTIGAAVTTIGDYAFYYCNGLKSMVILPEMPPMLESNAFNQVPSNIPLYVPCESVEAYQLASMWDAFTNIVGMCSPGTITVLTDPVEGGTATGAGTYDGGSSCTVVATPNEGYCFANWMKNDYVVSCNSVYSFIMTGESVLTARFVPDENIIFADANVKAICVSNWDTNGDGELSYLEAASVTSLGNKFTENLEITSFEELQYFINLTSIEYNAFKNCSGLTGSLIIPNSVTSIGNYAFYNCSGLTGSLILPNSVTSIGNYAFYNCSGLTGSLILPNSVTSIGNDAFYCCSGLTGSLIIPDSVTSIGNYTFYKCSGLTGSLTIPNSVTSIGYDAFSYCSGLTGSLVLPNSIITIGSSAFGNCNGLTGSLTIPDSVTSIGSNAFYRCSGLTLLTIGNAVTSIGSYAFSYCNGLKSIVVLPETPPILESGAFNQVSSGIPVYVPCEFVEAYQSASMWDAFTNIVGMCSSGTITVVADPVEGGTVTGAGTYEGGTSCTVTAMPNEGYYFINWTEGGTAVSSISNYSFIVTGESVLTARFVPDENIIFADANVKAICVSNWDTNGDGELSYLEAASVRSLGYVFKDNTEITSFEELQYFINLSSIGNNAFYNCSGLTGSLILPNSVTSIGNYAFYNCSNLNGSLNIPNSVTSIGNYAFYNCYRLSGILMIPNSVTSIGYYAFYNCRSLSGPLTIPDSLTSIESSTFYGCYRLTGPLTIPNSITTIGSSAFYGCYGLTGPLAIPNSVTTIGSSAFYGCYGLNGPLTIPDSVTTIGGYAFYNCHGLTGSLILSNSVTTIGNNAFYSCNGLTGSLTIPNSVTTIGSYAFYGCNGFTGNLTIGNSVTSIGSSAFGYCRNFTSMKVLPEIPPAVAGAFYSGLYSVPVYVPCSSLVAYQEASGWSSFTNYQEDCLYAQTVALVQGWNWFSAYIEMEHLELLNMLEGVLGENGLRIESQYDGLTEKIGDGCWWGDLQDVGIMSEQMYLIEVATDCTVELYGSNVDPAAHEITLYPEWTWIGFPCSEEVDIVVALSGLNAEEGDMIEGTDGVAEYLGGGFWYGLETLVPGQGYMYYSASNETKTLVFHIRGSKTRTKVNTPK